MVRQIKQNKCMLEVFFPSQRIESLWDHSRGTNSGQKTWRWNSLAITSLHQEETPWKRAENNWNPLHDKAPVHRPLLVSNHFLIMEFLSRMRYWSCFHNRWMAHRFGSVKWVPFLTPEHVLGVYMQYSHVINYKSL